MAIYTEILRIIEGGLSRDPKKVMNYARLLAEKLQKDGEGNMANMIIRALESRPAPTATMDELLTTPVDNESRMSMVDVEPPRADLGEVILPGLLDSKISNFIGMIRHRKDLIQGGVEVHNSLLLHGKPGCGKTTIARLISKQTGLPLVIARLDAVVSSLLGNTAKNIRKIFDFADNKPCILFLDEFDAIAKARDDQYELGELKRVINSLLQNIDNFSGHNILIAATNHPELLDKAIWRRFNTVIEVVPPTSEELLRLTQTYVNDYQTDFMQDEKKRDRVLKLMEGKTPSDIKTIINNTKAATIIHNKSQLTYEDLLVEIFEFNRHGELTVENLIEYLNENGIPQATIAERMQMSLRQVRNILTKNS